MITTLKPGRSLDERQQAERNIRATVEEIIEKVRNHGDAAVRELSVEFDKWDRESYRLSTSEIGQLLDSVPKTVIRDIEFAQKQIRTFAHAQKRALTDVDIDAIPGVRLGHKNIAVNSVGAYVRVGRYPMVASADMSVVTAKVAGVKRMIAATPPLKGAPPAATVAAIALAGADEIFVLGGVQAIAAFALGTATIDPVDMLVGPGNAYVAEAKRQLFGTVGIDLLAGPTETLIIADDTADVEMVATDLLGQAEHGPTSPAVLLTTSRSLAEALPAEIERQLKTLPTADVAGVAWKDCGSIILADSEEEMIAQADADLRVRRYGKRS